MVDEAVVSVTVPGTCGELVQGWSTLWDEPVLVSCPIAQYSRVRVQLCPEPDIFITGNAPTYAKSRQAARLALNALGRPNLGARLWLNSELQPGRGMASSTADIIGVMAGVATALDCVLTPGQIARLATRIEPSDSTMFAGLAVLAYRGSSRFEELGPVPELPLLMLDTGHPVDTLSYNARLNLNAVRGLAASTRDALDLLRAGLAQTNPKAIAAAATMSALSYQAVNYNPCLEQARRWAEKTGALGLVRAHSGSVIGLLYPPGASLAQPAQWLSTRFNGRISPTRLVAGSWSVCIHPAPRRPMEVNPVL